MTSPKDLLWEDPAWVVEAAQDESRECAHAREYDSKLNSIQNALESGEQSGIAEGRIETEVRKRIRQRALVKRGR